MYFHKTGMNLDDPSEFFEDPELAKQKKPLSLNLVMTGEFFSHLIQYPIILERWEYTKYGLGKRLYLKEFNEKERKKLGTWKSKFFHWYFRSGTPLRVSCTTQTITFLQRAVNFFASL